ncbi:hypothetical protein [Gilvimarinus algae]|uniref:ABC transporter permease n=1 Tax=Gilvimarinus algae TaxID=3058037 RepID=A0ABT8TI88_9GAMM|nr:hypothetical protein [Gilvimarinus sp. SDUM040014]MDO3383810.1 hypothetical protein [Gilvimarinus sp. SDUM040014]
MVANVNGYLALARYLFVPLMAWRILIVVATVLTLAVSVYFQSRGAGNAIHTGLVLIAVSISLGAMVLPVRIRELLASRVFVLAAPSARMLIVLSAFALAMWVLLVTALVVKGATLEGLRIAALVWALVSIAAAAAIVFPVAFFIVGWAVFFALTREPVQAGVTIVYAGLPDLALFALALTIGALAWIGLHRVALAGRITRNAFSVKNLKGQGSGPAFTLFSRIRLGSGEFERFSKTALLSAHPTLAVFLATCAAIVVCFLILALLSLGGDKPFSPLPSDESFVSNVIYLFLFSSTMVVVMVMNVVRRLRSLWLLLPGDRKALITHLERVLLRMIPVVILPVSLLYLGPVFFGELAWQKVVEVVVVSAVLTVLSGYWFLFVYGSDSVWSGLGSLILILVFSVFVLFSGASEVAHPALWCGVIVGLALSLVLRHKVHQRWARMDFTALPTGWPL